MNIKSYKFSLYDFANSAFTTVIITFFFSNYFAESIVQDMVNGQAYWGAIHLALYIIFLILKIVTKI